MPGHWPGGCLGLKGSLRWTKPPAAFSISATQLVPARAMPATTTGPRERDGVGGAVSCWV
jgi:hypothetical protein